MIVVDSLQLSPPIHHDHRRERVGSESGARGARRRGPASPIWPGFRSRSHNPALDREAGPTIRTKSETDQPRGPAAATRASIWPMTETGPTLWSSRPNCGRRPGSGPASRSGFGTGAAIRFGTVAAIRSSSRPGSNPAACATGGAIRTAHPGRNPDRLAGTQSGAAGAAWAQSGGVGADPKIWLSMTFTAIWPSATNAGILPSLVRTRESILSLRRIRESGRARAIGEIAAGRSGAPHLATPRRSARGGRGPRPGSAEKPRPFKPFRGCAAPDWMRCERRNEA